MGSSDKHLEEQHHIHYLLLHDQARQQDPSILSTCSPLAHFAHLYCLNSGHTCDEEHHPPHTDQASLAECSWLEGTIVLGRHHLSVFPQGSNQKRARLLRRHPYTSPYPGEMSWQPGADGFHWRSACSGHSREGCRTRICSV